MVDLLLILFAVYGSLGLVFALPFVFVGVSRVDPAAGRSPWGFRLLILPGVVGLWPVMLVKWLASRQGVGR